MLFSVRRHVYILVTRKQSFVLQYFIYTYIMYVYIYILGA